jgi:hypothetical protein
VEAGQAETEASRLIIHTAGRDASGELAPSEMAGLFAALIELLGMDDNPYRSPQSLEATDTPHAAHRADNENHHEPGGIDPGGCVVGCVVTAIIVASLFLFLILYVRLKVEGP